MSGGGSSLPPQDSSLHGKQVLTCLEEWMAQQKYQSIDEFKGRLSFSKAPNASMYERTQFMKYFGPV
ncbi:MAG: hypothetical protein ACTTKI_10295 [Tannerella sp.]|uniref:hypothetical protein n=1 Tax=Tannerella sp. TaxID=2382127 RepID=UPI003FA1CA8D